VHACIAALLALAFVSLCFKFSFHSRAHTGLTIWTWTQSDKRISHRLSDNAQYHTHRHTPI